MISWLPYREITVFTPLSAEEAVAILSSNVIERRFRWTYSDVGQFEGVVSIDGFHINRVIGYRNSWLPFLRGSFKAVEGGTQVTVRMTVHPLVWVISTLYCGGSAFGALVLILQGSSGFICPGAFFLVGYLMTTLGFNFEADKAVTFIENVFCREGVTTST